MPKRLPKAASLARKPGVEGARVRIETALLTDQAEAALRAWKDYFWLDDSDAPQALQGLGVTAIFTKGLAAGASVDDRLALADLLMRAGFSKNRGVTPRTTACPAPPRRTRAGASSPPIGPAATGSKPLLLEVNRASPTARRATPRWRLPLRP